MFSITNLLLNLIQFFQYYGLYFGYTYVYIDRKKQQLKFYIWAKVYFYIINLCKLAWTIKELKEHIEENTMEFAMPVFELIALFSDILKFSFYIVLHTILESTYRKFSRKILFLQNIYVDKLSQISSDKTIRRSLIVQMFLIFMFSLNIFYDFFNRLNAGDWKDSINYYFLHMTSGMSYCVLWYHGFILNYFNNFLLKFNYQLQYDQLQKSYAKVNINITLMQLLVNNMISPTLLFIIINRSITIAFFFYSLYPNFIDNVLIDNDFEYSILVDTIAKLSEFIILFAYFLICDQISKTRKNTGIVLMDYNGKREHNAKV